MKRIYLDLGNSRHKWINGDDLPAGKVTYKSYFHEPGQEIEDLVSAIYEDCADGMLVIASVRGNKFNQKLGQQLTGKSIEYEWITIPNDPLVEPAYTDWSQFGIDRYINMVAAKESYELPVIVVSSGTAVTFDLIDADGHHRGGCIFPGYGLLKQSLSSGTAQIGQSSVAGSVLATSTAEGVAGAAAAGLVAAVDGITREMAKETNSSVTVLLTGGDAERLNGRLTLPTSVDSLLLFKGMDKVSQRKA